MRRQNDKENTSSTPVLIQFPISIDPENVKKPLVF